jgi:hypothetical protein
MILYIFIYIKLNLIYNKIFIFKKYFIINKFYYKIIIYILYESINNS